VHCRRSRIGDFCDTLKGARCVMYHFDIARVRASTVSSLQASIEIHDGSGDCPFIQRLHFTTESIPRPGSVSKAAAKRPPYVRPKAAPDPRLTSSHLPRHHQAAGTSSGGTSRTQRVRRLRSAGEVFSSGMNIKKPSVRNSQNAKASLL
jgi:hypothetical protein